MASGEFQIDYGERRRDEERALQADPERLFRGEVMASSECDGEAPLCFDHLVVEHPFEFFRMLKGQPPRERVVMLSTYLLRKTQAQLAPIVGTNQSTVSVIIRTTTANLTWCPLPDATRKQRNGRHSLRFYDGATVVKADPDYLGEFRIRLTGDAKQMDTLFAGTATTVRSGADSDYVGAEFT